jgi:hypothetical protein
VLEILDRQPTEVFYTYDSPSKVAGAQALALNPGILSR